MVHTLPGMTAATGSRNSTAGTKTGCEDWSAATSSTGPGEVEKFSGLKIADRQFRGSRWDDLMRSKKYVPFDRISSIESLEKDSKDAVMIGVVYEKSLPKTASNGNEYTHWTFTDLAFPKPNVMTLFLHGQAFEKWEKEAEGGPIANGSILAILNPAPLASRGPGGKEERRAAKVNYGSQLVRLGSCPSLAYCTCTKKDGMKCSMPCDRDKGPSVCFYHSQQQMAQKAKQWNQQGSTPSSSSTTAARASKDGIFVIQAPSRTQQLPSRTVPTYAEWAKQQASGSSSQRPATAEAPARMQRQAGMAGSSSIDAATQRLLSGATPRTATPPPNAAQRQRNMLAPSSTKLPYGLERSRGDVQAGVDSAAQRLLSVPTSSGAVPTPKEASGIRPLASPARGPGQPADSARSAPVFASVGMKTGESAGIASDPCMATRKIQMSRPQGFAAPDPNNPLANIALEVRPCTNAKSSVSPASLRAASEMLSRPAAPQRRAWEQQRQPVSTGACLGPSIITSSQGERLAGSISKGASNFNGQPWNGKAEKRSTLSTAAKEMKRAEKEFGRKVAVQLNVSDPRKDLVRQQGSRFAAVVEQERIAKRHRQLADLEAQDTMAEKMEAITEISVQAWRCQQCSTTTESQRSKTACEEQGHSLTMVNCKKTRWECRACSADVFVLDRELPSQCVKCRSSAWKQGPLRRVAKAAMEKDQFLARGEELPFINSIHIPQRGGGAPVARTKEPKDDYAGL